MLRIILGDKVVIPIANTKPSFSKHFFLDYHSKAAGCGGLYDVSHQINEEKRLRDV